MKDYKNEIEMLRQAFNAEHHLEKDCPMPDAEAELEKFCTHHNDAFDAPTPHTFFFRKIAAIFIGILLLSGFAYAAIHTKFFTRTWSETEIVASITEEEPSTLVIVPTDSLKKPVGKVTFDNDELEDILTSICNAYKVEIHFKSEEQKHIRLHFSYDTSDKLNDVVESLNLFEKFHLTIEDKKLMVE